MLIIPAGRGITWAVGVYEVPRLCDPCEWVADWTVRPVVYRLNPARIDPSCVFHKRVARPKTRPKKARR